MDLGLPHHDLVAVATIHLCPQMVVALADRAPQERQFDLVNLVALAPGLDNDLDQFLVVAHSHRVMQAPLVAQAPTQVDPDVAVPADLVAVQDVDLAALAEQAALVVDLVGLVDQVKLAAHLVAVAKAAKPIVNRNLARLVAKR